MLETINRKFHELQNTGWKKEYWTLLIGNVSEFSLESRVFHSISICLIVACLYYLPYSLFFGLYTGALSALLIGLYFFYQYYYSRLLRKSHNCVAFGIVGLVVFGVNYFANSGIRGSVDVIWPAYLLVLLTISPYNQHIKWVLVYLLSVITVHAIEFYYPQLISYPIEERKDIFIDRISVFHLPVYVIYIIIRFIRHSYDTERKIAEEKTLVAEISRAQVLQQKIELEKLDLEKTKLMSIISHDLRGPLTSIQTYLSVLNENLLSDEERSVMEKYLQKTTNYTISMLSNLLNWTKSQLDGSIIKLETADVFEILAETIEMEKMDALKKQIELVDAIPKQILVITNGNMLQLVVRNLISNSIKFTNSGGIINITAQVVQNECEIIITDNGRGIAPDDQPSIFSIEVESKAGTNNERGVGLGLVLCKEFVDKLGGRIRFESREGKGSRFYIALPLA